MLYHKKDRIYVEGISFQIPNGFCVEALVDDPEGFYLRFFDNSYVVEGTIASECMDTYTELKYLFSDCSSLRLKGEITPFFNDGVAGHQAVYSNGDLEYFITRIALNDDLQLSILISGRERIEKLIRHPGTIALMQSFRKEKKYKTI